MFACERMLAFLAHKVKNRTRPEANVVRFYQHFKIAAQHRSAIEKAMAASPRAADYAAQLDSSYKLSPGGPAVTAGKFRAAVQGRAKTVDLSEAEVRGLVDLLRREVPEYAELMEEYEADAKRPGHPATWRPAGRELTDHERSMLMGPHRRVRKFPRATIGGLMFRASDGDPSSAATRCAQRIFLVVRSLHSCCLFIQRLLLLDAVHS
jgi:hypothetical protein